VRLRGDATVPPRDLVVELLRRGARSSACRRGRWRRVARGRVCRHGGRVPFDHCEHGAHRGAEQFRLRLQFLGGGRGLFGGRRARLRRVSRRRTIRELAMS
jgi:hypothetical protein